LAGQIQVPQRRAEGIGGLLSAAGGIIGSKFGPAGSAAGSAVGSSVGGMVDGDANKPAQAVGGGAIQRRMQPQTQSPQQALEDAAVALQSQPPQAQKEFGPQISQALAIVRRQNQQRTA
jgi:phage tail tape-measure protein